VPPPYLHPNGTLEAISYYDVAPLKATLERLVDFDRINACLMRFSVGAVNVRTGNFVYFDSTTHQICPEHAIASGSLPPVSRLQRSKASIIGMAALSPIRHCSGCSTAVRGKIRSLFRSISGVRGVPRNLLESETRQKEIRYSSRTRMATDQFKKKQILRRAAARLLAKIPEDLLRTTEAEMLALEADEKVYNLIQLIYRSKNYEGTSKDYEFSRRTMEEHWQSGYYDAVRTLRHPEVLQRPQEMDGVFTFDLARDGRE